MFGHCSKVGLNEKNIDSISGSYIYPVELPIISDISQNSDIIRKLLELTQKALPTEV